MKHTFSLWTILLLLTLFQWSALTGFAQSTLPGSNFFNRLNALIDEEVERSRWEVALNFDPSDFYVGETYTYMIKRNVGKGKKLGAWRFSLSPYFRSTLDGLESDKTKQLFNRDDRHLYPRLELGYEWQKVEGRFMLFYGVSTIWAVENSKFEEILHMNPDGTDTSPRGRYLESSRKQLASIGSLLGMKCHFTKDFSFSFESQLQLKYLMDRGNASFDYTPILKGFNRDVYFEPNLFYAINFSYHF
ncbi:hypothetical protein [Dyadobacter sp. CY326]|uniref:hypothetical protein n=1 Tax=Dyadobacter sp. CY326 TaxID=2907300 RepID=UPI001F3ED0C6|nr:hypothetical protein [Dyadobacter sp. CY326]MCE7066546.1 hypothetical protein [Dyadobacter sp. CY326]